MDEPVVFEDLEVTALPEAEQLSPDDHLIGGLADPDLDLFSQQLSCLFTHVPSTGIEPAIS